MKALYTIVRALLAAAILAIVVPAHAQYPNKPIRIIVPVPPGGAMDGLTRLIGEKLSTAWGQPVIVENRPGGGGSIGISAVVRALPDGYTILVTNSSVTTNPILYALTPYKLEELSPVSLLWEIPVGFAVHASVPADTLAEFVKLVRSGPNQYAYASYGIGSSAHMFGEMLKSATDMDLVHVPYKGEAPVVTDLIAGTVPSGFASPGTLAQYAKTGKVKLLAVTGTHRSKAYPNIATFVELGYPSMDVTAWHGLFVPARTPRPIVDRLSAEVRRIVHLPDVEAKIINFGYEPVGSTAGSFENFVRTDSQRWAVLIKQFNIKAD